MYGVYSVMQKVSWKLLIMQIIDKDLLSGFDVDRYGGNHGNIRCTVFRFTRLVFYWICLKNYIRVTVLPNTMKI